MKAKATTIKHGELNLRKVERKAVAGDYVVFSTVSSTSTINGKPYLVSETGWYECELGFTLAVDGWGDSDANPDIYEVFEATTIKHGELNLRKVTGRKADAGDFVVFKHSHNGTPQGEPFEVLSDGLRYNSNTHQFMINGWGGSDQYDLYEEVRAAKKGDKVKILALSKYGLNYIGKTGVVDVVDFFNEGWTAVIPTEEGQPTGLYLPEHLELIIEEETTLTKSFKVGDKVRVLNAENGRFEDLFDGAEGVIVDIDADYYEEPYKVHSEDADDYDRFEAKDIELIVTPAVEFKVGDKVEVLDASKGNFQDQQDGAIGFISDIHGTGIRVSIDGDFDRFPAEALRKVEDAAEAPQQSFKVGDKVRMISTSPTHSFGQVKTGDIGTICVVTDKMITANFPNQSYWNGVASEFELVEEAKELSFEEGDLIRITDKDQIDGSYDTTNGKTYEIIEVDEDGDISIMDDSDDELAILRREFGGIEKVDAEEATEDAFEQFQPGDKVVLLSGGGSFPLTGFSNGSEYEVRNNNFGHSEGRLIQIRPGGTYDNGYAHPSQLKKVEAPALTAALVVAKAGDFIEIDFDFVGGNFNYTDITKGKSYEVVTSKYNSSLLSFVDDEGDTRTAHIEQGAYTVVDAPATTTFKVGDRVSFVEGPLGNFGGYSLPEESRAGTVLEVAEGNRRSIYLVDIDNYPMNLNFTKDELTLEVIAKEPRKLQVGDIVRIAKPTSSRNPIGSIGEITEFSAGGSARVNAGYGETGNYSAPSVLELIVANENREDKK